MKTTVLSMFILFFSFSPQAQAQAGMDSVEADVKIMTGENGATVTVVIMPNKISATSYFTLGTESQILGIQSFSGQEDQSITYAFRIENLKCNSEYQLNFLAYRNDDSKQICGQKKISLKTVKCSKQVSASKKRKK